MEQMIIQITSGRGPAECCRVVARVQELIIKQARATDISIQVLENIKGDINGTLLSATLLAKGSQLTTFLKEWEGTVQWIAQSPYRKFHKRKNWFVGVSVFDVKKQLQWNPKDVTLETCRAAGPGGQHVNKVETAVRGIHRPSGLQVLAMDSRSQLQNKQLCLERLEAKFLAWQTGLLVSQQQDQWQEHNELERGQAVKVIRERL
ncbi:peptide chain release factor H [Chitinophaga sp. RAB17]|uniref:peptide chain release factor H n=1 Tax=Chitinophaga sp. RAB17 TaxID=3233049 RepID=UPI003F8F4525